MTEYSEAFKSKMVQRLSGPRAVSQGTLSAETGIPQGTLSRWYRAAGGRLDTMSKPSSPQRTAMSSARRPEDWTPQERLRAVIEAEQLNDVELGAFLRREGLHEDTLKEWRASALEGLAPQRRPGTSGDAKRVRELEKKVRRQEKALAEAAALLVLQKKVQAIWGDEDDDTNPKSGD